MSLLHSVFYCQHSRSLKGLALFTLHSMQAMRVFLLSNILGMCRILDQYLALIKISTVLQYYHCFDQTVFLYIQGHVCPKFMEFVYALFQESA